MNAKQILEMHFGSDFYRLEELECLVNIINAMKEYAQQENKQLILKIAELEITAKLNKEWAAGFEKQLAILKWLIAHNRNANIISKLSLQ